MNRLSREGQSGFTIIELMIATLVFSIVLIVVTVGVLKFTNAYYKGVNAATVQSTARTITDKVSQAVQFGNATLVTSDDAALAPSGANAIGTFCAGGYLFAYTRGIQYAGGTASVANAGLYMRPLAGSSSSCVKPTTSAELSGGEQLLSKGMRITDISLLREGANEIYTFHITLALTPDNGGDLLCTPNDTAIPCSSVSTEADAETKLPGIADVQCKAATGNEFCAVANLTTSIQKRVGGGI